MSLLSSIFRSLGFKRKPKAAKHRISEITQVLLSCGHMCRNDGYCFMLKTENDKWYFDADCFINCKEDKISFEKREIEKSVAEEALKIIDESGRISYAENYKKPKKSRFKILDETTYAFFITFSDGSRYNVYENQKSLERYFYQLAEDIGNGANNPEESNSINTERQAEI